MANVVGYSLIEHREDGSTEVLAKISPNTMAAAMAKIAGFGGQRSKYNYINADACPTHGPWKAVPAGVSKAGKPYSAFWACDQEMGEERCTNKPSREWVETHPPERGGNGPSQQAMPEPTGPSSAGEYDDLPF